MKKVIRRSVFETNSSSSHSLSLVKVGSKDDKILKRSFEIVQADSKIAMLLALINECEESYKGSLRYLSESFNDTELLMRIVAKINEYDSTILPLDKEITLSVVADALLYCNIDIEPLFLEEEGFSCFAEEYYMYLMLSLKNKCRAITNRFKNQVIKEYANSIGKTESEALKLIQFEGFMYMPIKEYLLDIETAEEKLLKYADFNSRFKRLYLDSGITNIVDFAKKYLIDEFDKFKVTDELCYNCTRYFGEGALYDCDCGFATYHEIVSELDLEFGMSNEAIVELAKRFISDDYKFVAREEY